MALLAVLVLVVLVLGYLVVPFGVGLIRGPRPLAGAPDPDPVAPAAPMQPLGTIARIYGGFMLLYLLLAVWEAKDGCYGSGAARRGVREDHRRPSPVGVRPGLAGPARYLAWRNR